MAEHLPGDAASLEQKAEEQKRLTVLSPDAAGRWAALAASMPCDSVKFLTRAIILSPGDFRLYVNLSNRYLASGEALRIWGPLRAAAILFPGLARAYEYLGVSIPVSVTGGDRRRLRAWSWICGGAAQAGVVAAARLIDLDRLEAASALLKEVISSDALSSEAWRQCALLEQKKARDKLARAAFRRAVLTAPNICDGYIAASAFLIDQREFAFAAQALNFAACLIPDSPAIWVNRSSMYEHQSEPEKAIGFSRRALMMRPQNAAYTYNVGAVLHDLGRVRESLSFHERAVLMDPDNLALKNNRAILLLKSQAYKQGFAEYENRWYGHDLERSPGRSLYPVRSFDLPLWKPAKTSGNRILLWGEQGIGDEIWGLGYISSLRGRHESFVVETDARLVPLVNRAFPFVECIPRNMERTLDTSLFDVQLPLLSLPHSLGLSEAPAPAGWARGWPEDRGKVRERLRAGRHGKKIVGLGWRSVKPQAHRSFGLSLDVLAELASLDDTLYLPLQYGMSRNDWREVEILFGKERTLRPDFDVWYDLPSLADAIGAVDVLVSAATSLVPLSVAAGTPAIALLNRVQRDWRYPPDASCSPLLPAVELMWPRQWSVPGSLNGAVNRAFQ